MLKFNVKKIVSLVVIITLVTLVFGSVSSLAVSITPADGNTNQSDTNTNVAENENTNTNTNTNTNGASRISSTVNGVGNNTNNNAASKRNTNNTTGLPYAGTNTSLVFVVIALVASALYAYKKVSDYNV